MRLNLPQFKSNKELFAYLEANKALLIEQKKSAIKHADPWNLCAKDRPVVKAAAGSTDTADSIRRDIVANTYLYMDSHDDVHLPGIFSKAIQSRTPFHLHDHVFQVDAEVGKVQSMTEPYMNWSDLGVNKIGQTQVLLADSNIQKGLNQKIFDKYQAGDIQQHSVGMIYVRLNLAVNDPDYKEAYALWSTYYPQLGNPEVADEKGYFWAVAEAKLPEFSCVLQGSNPITPTLETGKASTAIAPPEGTQEQPQRKSRFASIGSKIN